MSAALSAPNVAGAQEGTRPFLGAGWFRYSAALIAGVLTGLGWQPYGLWPLLLIGIPALTLLVRDGDAADRRSAFGVGYLYGWSAGHLDQLDPRLGSWIAVLLIAFEALFFGLLGLTLH